MRKNAQFHGCYTSQVDGNSELRCLLSVVKNIPFASVSVVHF